MEKAKKNFLKIIKSNLNLIYDADQVDTNLYSKKIKTIISKKKAVFDLERAGFKLGKTFYRQNEDLIPYTVLDQSIPAETVLEKPTNIDLTISVLDMQDIFNQMIK